MGEIFLAELRGAAAFRKLCVVKRLLPHLADDPEISELFLNEARLAAQLSHPNVCHVYELDAQDGQYYLVMELLQGASLSQMYAERRIGALDDPRLVVSLFQQACEGLHHVHELRSASGRQLHVIHRDVSPQNLFATYSGVLKLLDFGVAKIRSAIPSNEHSSIKGKFAYMSPEQIRGDELDRRSDLFSLGIVLFQTLTGNQPFARKTDILTSVAILEEPIPRLRDLRPDVPRALDAAVACAMSRSRDDRFPDAREMSRALVAAIGGATYAPDEIAKRLAPMMTPALARQRELIARARAQTHEIVVPELPEDADPGRVAGNTMAVQPAADTVWDRPRQPSRRGWAWIGAALAVSGIAAAIGVVKLRGDDPPREKPAADATAQASASPPAAPEPAVTPLTQPAEPPPPSPDAGAPSASPPLPPDSATTDPPDVAPARGETTARSERRSEHRTDRRGGARERASPQIVIAPPAEPGFIAIDSEPYANIFIDGEAVGDTPVLRQRVSAGKHKVRAVLEDGRSRTLSFDVAPGQVIRRKLEW